MHFFDKRLLIFGLFILTGTSSLWAQAPSPEPTSVAPGIQTTTMVTASTLPSLANVINVSWERVRIHPETGRGHGVTMGPTVLLRGYTGFRYGAHLTYTYLVPMRRNIFEVNLGLTVTTPSGEFTPLPIPAIAAGIRFQGPTSPGFFRLYLSTGGIGLGYGLFLKRP